MVARKKPKINSNVMMVRPHDEQPPVYLIELLWQCFKDNNLDVTTSQEDSDEARFQIVGANDIYTVIVERS